MRHTYIVRLGLVCTDFRRKLSRSIVTQTSLEDREIRIQTDRRFQVALQDKEDDIKTR